MVNNLDELAEMISRRDAISLNEAYNLINITQDDIQYELASPNPSYDEVVDILRDQLGIEPDYFDLFI